MPVLNDGSWVTPKGAFGGSSGFEVAFFTTDAAQANAIRNKGWHIDGRPDECLYVLGTTRGIGMDMAKEAQSTTNVATEALNELKDTLNKFRGTLANDLTAIKAAAARVQAETNQMKQAYLDAQRVLCSPEFEHAIANAERMAVALEAIGQLSETKLSVAVINGRQS